MQETQKTKSKAGLIIPIIMMTFGVYALMIAVGSSSEQVTLISDHTLPRSLAMIIALIGLVGGALIMFSSLNDRKPTDPHEEGNL